MVRIIYIGAIAALFFNVSTVLAQPNGIEVEEIKNTFDGRVTHQMNGNVVEVDGATESPVAVEMNLERYAPKNAPPELSILVSITMSSNSAFTIEKGESLVLMADGEEIVFTARDPFTVNPLPNEPSRSSTNARFAMSAARLEKITQADDVRFRIIKGRSAELADKTRDTTETTLKGRFSDKNIKAWSHFYHAYVL